MPKVKTVFACQNCGAQSPKWAGKCPSCGEWNTYVEEIIEKGEAAKTGWRDKKELPKQVSHPITLDKVDETVNYRISTEDAELNRVLGGGLVPGSLILMGGEPGIGKSTLLLQISLNQKGLKTLYVSGEESAQQIKMRAERIGTHHPNFFVLTETRTQHIFKHIKAMKPEFLVIDSIQTLQTEYIDSAPGSVSQIRECAAEMQRFAKETNTPVMLVGHITKEGSIAGPKILEHTVDTVLQFEGDRNYTYRILRTIKNRFGSASELGIYEMLHNGLREVSNPSEILITQREQELSGIAIAATIEGARPMLIETQALVATAVYGTPQRSATGFDLRRLSMLLAVLEKRCGFNFGARDVFLNIAGGLRVEDPAIDLAIVCALISSLEDVALPMKICFAAEVGLSGEIRSVSKIEQRISEADKLGLEKIFISRYNTKGLDTSRYNIEIVMVAKIEEIYGQLF